MEILVERKEERSNDGLSIRELWINEETGEYREMYKDPVSGYWTEL